MHLFKLLLFFDINKTILVKDVGSGKDTRQSLNAILSECTWGSFNATKPIEERSENDWSLLSSEPSCTPFESNSITFGEYLENFTKVPKSVQRTIKTNYVHEDIGRKFLPHYEQLLKLLTVPEDSEVSNLHEEIFGDGYFHILPSFFRFVDHLVEQRYDFRIVFRSFGVDTANVLKEFNLYCEGMHPYQTPKQKLDGSDPLYPIDLRVQLPFQSASILRTSETADGIHLNYVNENKVSNKNLFSILLFIFNKISRGLNQLLTTVSGAKAVYQTLVNDLLQMKHDQVVSKDNRESLSKLPFVFAVRDDFSYWHRHHESDDAGKIILIDPSHEVVPENVIQIFFDDNIERTHAHIVDVRNIHNFERIPFEVANDRYIKRVEPWSLITDPNYYIDTLNAQLLRNYPQYVADTNKEL
jgi:hypothetical protein